MEKEFNHYFINKEHKKEDYFSFETTVLEKKLKINSCSDVFSKDQVDYGTNLLISTIAKTQTLHGNCLDLCCGYGIIGIALAIHFKDCTFDLIDINKNAVMLSKQNAKQNGVRNINQITEGNSIENKVQKYNFVVTNPPIKAGKENLYKVLNDAMASLQDDGAMFFVMKKKHGLDSTRKYLNQTYHTEVLKRDKTYYIVKVTKQDNIQNEEF